MKILITGINGFVGNLLYKYLQERGDEVYGIDIEGNRDNIFSVDITNYDSVNKTLIRIAPDFIFHLAAISRVDVSNPRNIFNINVNGTLNLLSASIKLKIIPKFLFISSSQVYGIVDRSLQPMRENLPLKPVNLYGASKAAAENMIMAFHHEFGLPFIIIRPFNHTGRGQAQHFVIPKLIEAFKDNKNSVKVGNIQVYRDFLDVRDVIDAYIKIMDNFPNGEIFNISSGKNILISDIISLMKEITGHDPKIISEEGLLRKNEIVYSEGDSSKIKQKLNWEPQISLRETLEWMLEDGKTS